MFMKKKKLHRSVMTPLEQRNILGDRLNFGASEAYKLLRTNLEFSLPKSDVKKLMLKLKIAKNQLLN